MKLIPYARHWVTQEDISKVVEVLRGDWLTQGSTVDRFEAVIADYVGAKYAVAFNSGTSALHGAMFAAGVGPGDEVLTSPMTFVASSNAALYLGAKPWFLDIDPHTGCIDLSQLDDVTCRPKAIVPVDYAGYPMDIGLLMDWAQKRDCIVIEDAAHALGAIRKGQKVGNQAHMTMFSFHPAKHATTGEGGVITTNDSAFRDSMLRFRSHGITKNPADWEGQGGGWYYEMQDLGYNYRITDFQCALGISQMDRIEQNILRRNQLANAYDTAFQGHPNIRLPARPEAPQHRHAFHLYPVQLVGVDRSKVFHQLRDQGILTQVHYIPVHLQPYYQKKYGFKKGDFPQAEQFYEREISLPMYHHLTDEDQKRVIDTLFKILNER